MTKTTAQKTMSYGRNPWNSFGFKCYSKYDEDGILSEIFSRIKSNNKKVFIDFGIKNALQNNTIQLILNGWHGSWIGRTSLPFTNPDDSPLHFLYSSITLNNINQTITLLKLNHGSDIGFLNVDVNQNDPHFLKECLIMNPKVICIRYNSKISPPGDFCVPYDDKNNYEGDDFFGASLQHYINMLTNYFLVCCNCTGDYAFFVRKELKDFFKDVPKSITDIYVPPNTIDFEEKYKASIKMMSHIMVNKNPLLPREE